MKLIELPIADQAKMLNELVLMPGWQLICEIIEMNKITTLKRTLEEDTHKDLAAVELLQYKISVCKEMIGLPKKVLEDIQSQVDAENGKGPKIDADPYFETAEEIDDANQEELDNQDKEKT